MQMADKVDIQLPGGGIDPGESPLRALHREVHSMAQISADVARGLSVEHAISRAKVFSRRTGLVRNGLARMRTPQWLTLLETCHRADRAIKGLGGQSPWLLFEQIVLHLCGQPPASANPHVA